jgi:hypothetical protein
MSNGPSALFVRHKALPGKREEARRIWEKHVRPRVEKNPDHLAYYGRIIHRIHRLKMEP